MSLSPLSPNLLGDGSVEDVASRMFWRREMMRKRCLYAVMVALVWSLIVLKFQSNEPATMVNGITGASSVQASHRPIPKQKRGEMEQVQAVRELNSEVGTFVSRVSNSIKSWILADSRYEDFVTRCQNHVDSGCRRLYLDIVHYAVAQSGIRASVSSFGVSEIVERWGVRRVQASLGMVVSRSSDPIERIASLVALTRADSLQPPRLDLLADDAYNNLRSRPLIEGELLAELHRRIPIASDRVANEFVALASEADARARRAALLALGHPETAEQLHQIVSAVLSERPNWPDLAMAVMVCGQPCEADVLALMHSGRRDIRIALYEALSFAPEIDRRSLQQQLLESQPPNIDQDELTARTDFIGGIQARN